MTTIYDTVYSTYEVDEDNKQIRRLESSHAPTPRQGEDGSWKPYEDLQVGDSLTIIWAYVDGVAQCTVTSSVICIRAGIPDTTTPTEST